jgi:outer membrane protein TolC
MSGCVIVILSLCLIIAARPASAGEGDTRQEPVVLSIDEAVRIAMDGNSEYRIALRRVQEAEEEENRAWSALMPELSSEAALMRQSADSGFMSLSDGQYSLKFLQLQLAVNPGVFYHTLESAHKTAALAREDLRRVKNELEFNVIKSYFDCILARETQSLLESSVNVLRENLKDVEQMFRSGSVPRYELLQAQVRLKAMEPKILEARNGLRLAMDMFNFHLGSGSLAYAVQESGAILGGVREPEGGEIMEELIASALRNRPEVVQLIISRQVSEHAVSRHSSAYLWPTFSVSGYYGMTYLLPNPVTMDLGNPMLPSPDLSRLTGEREWQRNWQVNAAATYRWGTLIPAHGERALERKERLRIREMDERIEQIKRATAITVRSSYGSLVSACESIRSQKKNIETAEEGLRIAWESYRNGLVKNAELLDAELALTEARTGFIRALYDYYINRAELSRQTGAGSDSMIFGEKKR